MMLARWHCAPTTFVAACAIGVQQAVRVRCNIGRRPRSPIEEGRVAFPELRGERNGGDKCSVSAAKLDEPMATYRWTTYER
jgi:hypothetical protein